MSVFNSESILTEHISNADLRAYFVGFDFGKYRYDELVDCFMNTLVDFSFGYHEGFLKQYNRKILIEAAKSIYKIEVFQKAKEMYKIAFAKDSTDYISLYNLGVLQLNVAEEAHKVANDIPEQKKYDAAIKDLQKLYEEALPYFTKVVEIKPDEKNSISYLKELYFRLRNEKPEYMKKYEEFKAKMDNM